MLFIENVFFQINLCEWILWRNPYGLDSICKTIYWTWKLRSLILCNIWPIHKKNVTISEIASKYLSPQNTLPLKYRSTPTLLVNISIHVCVKCHIDAAWMPVVNTKHTSPPHRWLRKRVKTTLRLFKIV